MMNSSGQNNPYPQYPYYVQSPSIPADPSQIHAQIGAQMIPLPMAYGSAPLQYPPQIVSQPVFPPPPVQQQLMSPGALARQQRASADSKRGKRRRPIQEGPSTSGGFASGEGGSIQIVPSEVSGDPAGQEDLPPSKQKDERRKKRLLRNRVSAQQARERKRQHMVELEEKCEKLVQSNSDLEQQIDSLSKENEDLRKVVRNNMRPRNPGATSAGDGSGEGSEPSRVSRPKPSVARRIEILGYPVAEDSDSGAQPGTSSGL